MRKEMEIWESEPRESMVSVTVGRAVNTVLAVRPSKLEEAVYRQLSFDSQQSPASIEGSLDSALWFLMNYVNDALERNSNLDELLVPLIQHWLGSRRMKIGGQSVILIDWLFHKENIFKFVAKKYIGIITRKTDRSLALSWCVFTRSLVQIENLLKDFQLKAIKDKYIAFVNLLCSCIPKLLQIVLEKRFIQEGYELPNRLSVAAADCILGITVALTKMTSDLCSDAKLLRSCVKERPSLSYTNPKNEASKEMIQGTGIADFASILWNQIDVLIALLQKLHLWSKKSRSLHSFGVERVLAWLQELKTQNSSYLDDQTSTNMHRRGQLLLSSCWKHYSILLPLEDSKICKIYLGLLDQYISGIQHYTNSYDEDCKVITDEAVETRKFFLNCICLLLGRLDDKKLELLMLEKMVPTFQVLLQQLRSVDNDLVSTAVCIFRAIILRPKSFEHSHTDNEQIDASLHLLLDILDKRDTTSKPLVLLVAELCSINMENFFHEILDRLGSASINQRRNAVLIITELVNINPNSVCSPTNKLLNDVINKLVSCMSDEDQEICKNSSNLLTKMDPASVLPTVFQLLFSSNERVAAVASRILKGILINHRHKFDVIRLFLDCMSNTCGNNVNMKTGSTNDSDPARLVILDWSENVKKWELLIPPLLQMMFTNPENATIVRFMSYISEYLAEAADLVMHHVLSQMKGHIWLHRETPEEKLYQKQNLYERLSPLLVIRLLPLMIFDNVDKSVIYGSVREVFKSGDSQDSIVGCLFERAFNASEFDEVRRLSAELCGRIHPQVLIPVVLSCLDHAISILDITKMKACLFSVCTSLTIKGRDTISHLNASQFTPTLEKILLLPSVDTDEVFKAQHGCIDCLALMICADMQFLDFTSPEKSVVDYVIDRLLHAKSQNQEVPRAFRICMANSLISACQKIPDIGKTPFARKILPRLSRSVAKIAHADVRAACIQVMFSAVYHLKLAVVPHAQNLLQVSVKALSSESAKERVAGAKLLAALMASEEAVLQRISMGLLEAKPALVSALSSDSSLELKEICKQLLSILAAPSNS